MCHYPWAKYLYGPWLSTPHNALVLEMFSGLVDPLIPRLWSIPMCNPHLDIILTVATACNSHFGGISRFQLGCLKSLFPMGFRLVIYHQLSFPTIHAMSSPVGNGWWSVVKWALEGEGNRQRCGNPTRLGGARLSLVICFINKQPPGKDRPGLEDDKVFHNMLGKTKKTRALSIVIIVSISIATNGMLLPFLDTSKSLLLNYHHDCYD